jgi:large subunit ribosomal protein L2
MTFKKIKPTTPSQRNLIKIKDYYLNKIFLIKSDVFGTKNSSGRNSLGTITSFHKGGGHKRKYRKINFCKKLSVSGIITSIEYDPYRTANIASVFNFSDKKYFYMLAPKNLLIGDIIKSGPKAELKLGHSLPFSKIPVGSLVHNVSVKTGKKFQVSRSAGTFSQLIEKTANYARIKLSSGEQRYLSINCYATIGIVSNEFLFLTTLGKAGRARWLNKRPKVRGVAMNPIDHPHGGGEGKTSGGRTSVTPWGKPCKSNPTSTSKNKLVIKTKNI